MINDKDITVVVQGPVLTQSRHDITQETTHFICLRIKELFPESELILSTWHGERVDTIPYDKVIFNKDPGATWFNYHSPKMYNNCNRMIVSTLAGITAASRPYVFKLRSDLFVVSKRFLDYFDKYPLYNKEYQFVKSRILAFSMWSIQGHKTPLFTMPKPFHISDWAYFGYKEDLLNLYQVPLIIEPDFSQWFLTRCKPFFDITPDALWKMPPEQHITSSFLAKNMSVHLEHTADDSHNNMDTSSQLLMNNFLVLDQTQFFLISLKHLCFQFTRRYYEWFIYHKTWLDNYYRFIPYPSLERLSNKIGASLRHISLLIVYRMLRIVNSNTHWIDKIAVRLLKKWGKKKCLESKSASCQLRH